MKTLVWMLGYAIGYHFGFGDGLKWGRLNGNLEAVLRRGWNWKGRV